MYFDCVDDDLYLSPVRHFLHADGKARLLEVKRKGISTTASAFGIPSESREGQGTTKRVCPSSSAIIGKHVVNE